MCIQLQRVSQVFAIRNKFAHPRLERVLFTTMEFLLSLYFPQLGSIRMHYNMLFVFLFPNSLLLEMYGPRFGVTDPEVLKAGLQTLVVCVCTTYSRLSRVLSYNLYCKYFL